uniref:Uncharacterized protein LOC114347859 n=1 Tax=Diabrotica virgifera virgifera TaxID=50390 RepID=A0A6P7H6Z4_DIAVI
MSEITLYLWKPKLPCSVGHIAMQFPDGEYISFWPSTCKSITAKGRGCSMSYKEDIKKEKREADKTLKLPSSIISQKDAINWWNRYLCSSSTNYNLVAVNCATSVFNCLVQGGILSNCA